MLESLNNNEIISSVKNTINDRIGDFMYGSFFISWCVWNWEAFYITIFVDQEIILNLYGQLKIDYILAQYHWTSFWTIIKLAIGPIISTYLIIWWLSKIDFICHKKYLSNKFDKEKELSRQQNLLLRTEGSLLRQKGENIKLEKEIKKELTDEERWTIEEREVKKNKIYAQAMEEFKICLYSYNGQMHSDGFPNGRIFQMSSAHVAFLDVNGLIDFNEHKTYITATLKGKFFMKKYIESNN